VFNALFLCVSESSRLLDIGAVAQRLAVTERQVRRLVAERRIPYVKVGRFVRFDPDDIDEWISEARVRPRCRRTWFV
jgi:excisionase family DNA binding protein